MVRSEAAIGLLLASFVASCTFDFDAARPEVEASGAGRGGAAQSTATTSGPAGGFGGLGLGGYNAAGAAGASSASTAAGLVTTGPSSTSTTGPSSSTSTAASTATSTGPSTATSTSTGAPACGGIGEACCASSPACAGDLGCIGGTCQSCGAGGERCCPTSLCDQPALYACNPATDRCAPCGGFKELCCNGTTCDGGAPTLKCMGGRCQHCCADCTGTDPPTWAIYVEPGQSCKGAVTEKCRSKKLCGTPDKKACCTDGSNCIADKPDYWGYCD